MTIPRAQLLSEPIKDRTKVAGLLMVVQKTELFNVGDTNPAHEVNRFAGKWSIYIVH